MRRFIYTTLNNIVKHNEQMVKQLIGDLGTPVISATGQPEYHNVNVSELVDRASVFVKLGTWTKSQMPMIEEHLRNELAKARVGSEWHGALAHCHNKWDHYNEGLISSVEAVVAMHAALKPLCNAPDWY